MIPTPARIRRTRIQSLLSALLVTGVGILIAALGTDDPRWIAAVGVGCACLGYGLYRIGTGRMRARLALLSTPMLPSWRGILEDHVRYYRRLDPVERERFENLLRIFLAEKEIVACGVEVDDRTRVLIGASAVIPIFGFPAFEYGMLDTILVHPHPFDIPRGRHELHDEGLALGMVGDRSIFSGTMVLSKPDLLRGFGLAPHGEHVGIHEFAHLIDKANGQLNGIPAGLPYAAVRPWMDLVHEELHGQAPHTLPPYAYTNEEEFLAVTSELFFEQPERLQEEHPALYDLLCQAYHQNPVERIGHSVRRFLRATTSGSRSCPCGSGLPLRACCAKPATPPATANPLPAP